MNCRENCWSVYIFNLWVIICGSSSIRSITIQKLIGELCSFHRSVPLVRFWRMIRSKLVYNEVLWVARCKWMCVRLHHPGLFSIFGHNSNRHPGLLLQTLTNVGGYTRFCLYPTLNRGYIGPFSLKHKKEKNGMDTDDITCDIHFCSDPVQ